MARKLKSDAVLFTATMLLLAVSMAWVYSASVVTASEKIHDPAYFVIRQGVWVAIGLVLLFGLMRLDYRVFRNRTALMWVAGATVVALVAVFFCRPSHNAHRWLGVGSSLGIQPSELAKLVAILFVATVLERRLEEHESLDPGLIQASILLVVFAALIIREPDYGSAVVLLATACAMAFVAGLSYRRVVTALVILPWPLIAIMLLSLYRVRRWVAFLNPYDDPFGVGFQPIQSLIAVGTGGVWGKGFMAGVQKMFYLPEAHTDYIFAVIAEERGLVGAVVVLLCFAVIIWRGLRVAHRAPDAFGSLLAVGITTMIGLQAMVNLGVVIALLPSKGIPLPFVSAGGSSMLVSLMAMGVLLNISQQASATE
jgi:cell division protein FtsW